MTAGGGRRNTGLGLAVALVLWLSVFSSWAASPPPAPLQPPVQPPGPEDPMSAPIPDPLPQEVAEQEVEIEYVDGVVLRVQNLTLAEMPPSLRPVGSMNTVQAVQVKLTSGPWQGRVVTIHNLLSGHPGYDIPLEPGAGVLVSVETHPGKTTPDINIADRARAPALGFLFGLFLLALLLVGGPPTSRMLILVALLVLGLANWVLPESLVGVAPLLLMGTTLGVFCAGAASWMLENRVATAQTLISCLLSLTVVGLACGALIVFAPLRGFSTETLAAMWQTNPTIDFAQLLAAGVLLAHTGLIFHLVATTVQRAHQQQASRYTAVLGLGRPLLATLGAGLVLVYLGLNLPMMLEITEIPLPKFINLESVTSTLGAALCGGLGLVASLPITALVVGLWPAKPGVAAQGS